jgi:uncharacterized membrane protein
VSLPDLSSDQPRGVLVRRPRTSIYTVLLLVALLAIAFSCLLLVLELFQYGLQIKPPANLQAAVPADVAAPLIV